MLLRATLLTTSAIVIAHVNISSWFSMASLTLRPVSVPSRYSIQAYASITCLLMRFQLIFNREGTDALEGAEAVYSALLDGYFDVFVFFDVLGLHQLLGQS